MKEDQYEVAQLKHLVDKMADVAYDEYCNLAIAIDSLEQIVNVPNTVASDARAIKEVIRIATEALDMLSDRKIAELPS
jgi:hypothetical protein